MKLKDMFIILKGNVGRLTQFHIHNASRSLDTIQCGQEGNLYAWQIDDWSLNAEWPAGIRGSAWQQDICGPTSLIIVRQYVSVDAAVRICSLLNGQLTVRPWLEDFEEATYWYYSLSDFASNIWDVGIVWTGFRTWTSVQTNLSAKYYYDMYTNKTVSNLTISGEQYEALHISCGQNGCGEEDGSHELHPICLVDQEKSFRLIGLTPASVFDSPYKPVMTTVGMVWANSMGGVIVYDSKRDGWYGRQGQAEIFVNATSTSMMIGIHNHILI